MARCMPATVRPSSPRTPATPRSRRPHSTDCRSTGRHWSRPTARPRRRNMKAIRCGQRRSPTSPTASRRPPRPSPKAISPNSHATLEAVREAFGALHARNGIETFSDRMNAYHAQMEHILGLDLSALDAAGKQAMLEQAAVLAYLAQDVLAGPPGRGRWRVRLCDPLRRDADFGGCTSRRSPRRGRGRDQGRGRRAEGALLQVLPEVRLTGTDAHRQRPKRGGAGHGTGGR